MPSIALGTLPRRYSALFALGLAPVLLILGGLVLWQFHEQRVAMLEGLSRTAAEQRLALGTAMKPVRDYVQRLRRAAEAGLDSEAAEPARLRGFLRHMPADPAAGIAEGVYLDDIAGRPEAARSGNLVGAPGLLSGLRPDPAEIDMALGLMEQMWLGHADTPYLRWSYYFSAHADLASVYPFAGSRELVADRGFTNLGPWFQSWFDYDIVRGATPDANPGRDSFWTPAYVDGNGAGWMMSHAAPVYDGQRFAGVVGTDIVLPFFADFLGHSQLPLGRAWIVDGDGRVVAGPGMPVAGAEQAPALANVLPTSLAGIASDELLRDGGDFRRLGDSWVMAQPIEATPLRMLWIVPAAELDAAILPAFLPSALILAGLALALVLAQWLLQRLFVRPALTLVDHVHAESRGRSRPLPRLPGMWRTLADRVSEAFAARRQLDVVSTRFEAAAESLMDGLAIWDADDRLVYHNSRYPLHLTANLRAALRPGIRFEDWIREGLASGPIYHPDMGEDFVARRLAMRRQDHSDHEHRVVDGRWVRVRESRMAGGGRVLLTSDVSQRRDQAEALADQTRKLEAVLANIAEGVTLVDNRGRVLLVNDGFMWLYGFPAELAKPGTPVADFIRDRLRRGDLRPGDEAVDGEEELEAAVQRRLEHLLTTPSYSYEEPRPGGRLVQVHRRRLPDGLLVSTYTDVTESRQHERELAMLAAAIDQTGDSVEISTPDYALVYVNPAFTRLTGFTAREAIGKTPAQLLRSDHHGDAFFDEIDRTVRAGGTWTGRLISRHKHGHDLIQDATISPLHDASGRLIHFVAVKRDVSERERVLEALRDSEERYRGVVEAQTEFIIRQRPDGAITFTNEAFCRHRGMSRQRMLADYNDLENLPAAARDEVLRHWADLSPERPTTTYDLTLPQPDGSVRYEQWTDRAVFDPQGWLVEYQSIGRDTTEQRRAEIALRASERVKEIVLEAALDCVIGIDGSGRIVEFNAAAERTFGRSRAEVLGQDMAELLVPPAMREAHRGGFGRHLETGETRIIGKRLQLPALHADGHEFPVELVVVATPGDQAAARFVAYMRDITEQRRAEQALRESEERFRTVVEDQVEFISRFSPDFRFTFVNLAYARQLGGSREELLGASVLDLMTPEQQRRFTGQLAELTPERPTITYEMDGPGPDGSPCVEMWTDRALFDREGRLVEYQSVGRDITAQKRAERALRESEERYRTVVQDQTETIGRFDARFRRTFANDADCRLHGRPLEELLGQDFFDSVAPRVKADLRRRMLALTPDNPVDIGENERALPDGSVRWFSWTNRALFDAEGRVTGYQSVGRDITEERKAEQALRESEARLAGFLENAPVGMYLKSVDGRYLMANREMAKVFGRPVEEMIGRTAADVLTPEAARMVRGYDLEVIETGQPTVHEEYLEDMTDYAWTMVIRFPVRDAGGAITHIGGFDVDISAQKAAERALKESEQRFRQFAEAHPVPLVVLRLADFRVLFVNPAYLDLLQHTAEGLDALDKHQLWGNPAERAPFLERLRRDGEIQGYDLMVRRKDGSVFPARMSSRVIEYAGERAMVTSVIDLSQQKAAEAEIQRQREALHQSEKLAALGSLLAGVAHELNNPLSVVVGYSSMLEEFAPDEPSRRRAERVHAAADRCARIVKAFLAMARQKPPKFGPVALNHVVEAALELAAYGLRTADIEVVRQLDTELPAVWGDSDQLHQVLTNLIVNAQHAMQQVEGPRRLVLRSEHRHGEVALTVEDNGPGMPEEVRKRIFEPFFTTKPQGMGVGVGLSLCHGIVSGHGGRIEVETEPGRGSRFVVTLPLSLREVANGEPARIEPGPSGRGRVLVVDDEVELADLVREILSRDGYEVTLARSGREALSLLAALTPDIIVSDLRMPDLDGPGLWRELKSQRPELAARMIFVTGDTLGADASRFLAEAEVPVMEKPLDLAELRRRVGEVVERGLPPLPSTSSG
ncbi:MAG TPA: PAS domain S-box protein [Geminicoccus sp.]|nr:PAS domain S-box protein [Geminicoccus sp.]